MNHDCIGSLGSIPNEPKTPRRLFFLVQILVENYRMTDCSLWNPRRILQVSCLNTTDLMWFEMLWHTCIDDCQQFNLDFMSNTIYLLFLSIQLMPLLQKEYKKFSSSFAICSFQIAVLLPLFALQTYGSYLANHWKFQVACLIIDRWC